ncbi:ADP-heptose:LPS heptosyltransferase [Candidatus Magnetobacterium bavaricum]|uniref:Lipopolysaccharide heptosyltransferase 1 n=1 Tax=Candidatus Magnetobacterium bavaricum TaxID=29290 RepID=A0A0F3GRQ2_9BACT|nr:ADP-heptose:LPS heptosyltransferase [Candidatus Magnetobacterium bavaricum]
MKILIIKPSSLGDVIHALPFLSALRGSYPQAEIHWVIARGLYDLLDGHPMINRLWPINKDQWKRPTRIKETLEELNALRVGLREERFDAVVDLQGLFRSGLVAALSGCPLRIGFREAREGSRLFYNQVVEGGKNLHAVDRYLRVATTALGCKAPSVDFPLPVPELPAGFTQRDFAVIIPGARWETKQWETEKFGQVAARLPMTSVVIGSADDAEAAAVVVEHSAGKAINLVGRTSLKDIVGIIGRARLVITNDTGPMHIAAALNVPVFALFGPTDPQLTGPYGSSGHVFRTTIECSPCRKKNCRTKKCLRDLSFQSVYETIIDSGF